MLVVAYQGAAHAPDTVTRDKAAAAARAAELLAKVSAGADLGALARTESDAPSSAARDGIMGTHGKDAWPPLHAALRDPLFSLPVGATAPQPLEADYGYVLLQRCPVEKARSRHILVRYKGAKNADKSIKRSRARAEAQAQALLTKVQGGADFAALAKAESDDSSKERGGDVGLKGRGLLAPAYDRALFSMEVGKLALVETDFGFHVIERLPDDGPKP
jgi:parvulin-like peptidyl-prolyl isomerase